MVFGRGCRSNCNLGEGSNWQNFDGLGWSLGLEGAATILPLTHELGRGRMSAA